MKKIIASVIAIAICATLFVACGSTKDYVNDTTNGSSSYGTSSSQNSSSNMSSDYNSNADYKSNVDSTADDFGVSSNEVDDVIQSMTDELNK